MQITSIHHIEGTSFEMNPVQRVYIVFPTVADVNESRKATAQIQQGMHLDSPTRLLIRSPGTKGKAEINHCGVERIDGVVEFHSKILMRIQGTGDPDEHLGQILVDAPIATFIGFGQSGL